MAGSPKTARDGTGRGGSVPHRRSACFPASIGRAAAWLAIVLTLSGTSASAQPEVARHDMTVRLDPASRTLAAEDTLTVRHAGESPLSFRISASATVEKVVARGRTLPFALEGGNLRVDLPPDLLRDDEISLAVAYRAPFRDSVPEDPVNTEDPSYGVAGTIRERGTFLSDEAGWYPEIPGSSPTFRLRVEGPEGYEAVSAGTLLGRETKGGVTRSEWETRQPIGGLSLSAGPYVVREGKGGGIPLYTFFYPETDRLSGTYLAAVARYLDMYRKLLGPYPFDKFAVVENFLPTGYGFPSYTLLGSTVVRLPFIVETSLGHEVAHSWFGNGVQVDYARGNWSEGLTTYVADHLYKERSSAEEGREYRLKLLRDYATLVPPEGDFPLSSFTGRDSPATRAIGYGKGAMVFHMARRLAGEEAFWKGLRDVVRERMFRPASWDDFARAFGRESGIDFAPFFRQWVENPGAPVIALRDVEARRDGKQWRVSGKINQEKPYYDLRVPVRLVAGRGNTDTVVPVAGEEGRFVLFSKSPPLRLVADPNHDLFRRLDRSEVPPTVNGIRGSTNLLVVAARGLPEDVREASKLLLAAMGKDNVAILREEETPPSQLSGHDVLYFGLPDGKGYLPPLPRELSVSPEGFALGGGRYGSRKYSLFAVLPHPSDEERVAGVFLSFSPEAASQAARKIPHYGKYSYLAFSEGTNRAKGTWEVTSSPTIHVFSAEN